MTTHSRTLYSKTVTFVLLLCVLWTVLAGAIPAAAQETQPPVAQGEVRFVGLTINPSPATLVVPKNTGTLVTPLLVRSDGVTGTLPALPEDAIFLAELRGPAFGAPIPLSAPLNGSFPIPPLALAGNYTLEKIRLVHNGEVIVQAEPAIVPIEVIERVLETQVTVRPLTAEEINQKGIYIDQNNFQVVNFTVAFGLENGTIDIEFPVLMPRRDGAAIPGLPLSPMPSVSIGSAPASAPIPALQTALKTPNIQLTGFGLSIPEDQEPARFNLPPIPGVVIIPGNIGYLNQFFSVMVKVSNAAPAYANLVVKDLTAEIILPNGADNVAGSSDDPLRMARLGNPPVDQSKIQPIARAGADGQLGTADDIVELAPQTNGDAEFLVEGVREGVHKLNFKIVGMLHGLPSGPVRVEGVAVGMVEVRNPRFALTIHHPETVTAGEQYDFMVTVTNISDTPANFLSLSLLPRSISGAVLESASTVQINTVEPGDSATATFKLRSQKTGTVTSNSLAADGIPGKFEFFTAVGELGIPMSPNVLSLPKEARNLPADLYQVGVGLLGQAYAVATAPFPPKGLLPMGRTVVYERATDLSAAGQRVEMGEALTDAARDIALDFMGNNFTRIDSQYTSQGFARIKQVKDDFRGFDELLRKSRRGAEFMRILGDLFGEDAAAQGILEFQRDFAEAVASRPGHLSVIVGNDNGPAPVLLSLVDATGKRLGVTNVGAPALREIPYGNFFNLMENGSHSSQMALLAVPQAGQYTIEVMGTADGVFDLGLVLPEGDGLRRVTFENIAITAGGKASLWITVGGSNTFGLNVDNDNDGTPDAPISATVNEAVIDRGPAVISATSIFIPNPRQHFSKYGVVMAVLFSEEVDMASVQHNLESSQITKFVVADNRVLGVYLQPRGRVATLSLSDGIGPFVDRSLTTSDIADIKGNVMQPASASVPIRTQKMTAEGLQPIVSGGAGRVSGIVRRADGSPVPNARLYMSQLEYDLLDEPYWVTVTAKDADANGAYSFDFIRMQPTRWTFFDPDSGERGELGASPSFNGHHLQLDLILRGRGTLTGRVLSADGQPLAGAYVRARPISGYGLGEEYSYTARSNAQGVYVLAGVPVGLLALNAVHAESRSQTVSSASLEQPGSTVVLDLTLLSVDVPQNFGHLEGQVFRADGVTPAAGIPVYSSKGGVTTTDASGFYRIENLPVDTVTVVAIDQERLEEARVRTTLVANSTVTANLILYGGTGTVRGVVLDSDGNPLPGLNIYGGFVVVQTDANGEFVLTDVPVGQREVSVVSADNTAIERKSVRITRPGEEVSVQLVFPVRGTLAGRVFRADGVTPVPNLKVFALGPRNEIGYTDSEGGYRFEGMPKGDYTISAFFPDWSDGNLAATKIVFKDETRVVNVIFRGTGSVQGTIFDDDGVTPLGARVALSEYKPKIGQLIPKENPECLADIDLGGGQKIDLPDCENVVVDWSFILRSRYVNSNISSGNFTYPNVFTGDFRVESANPFSPKVVSTKGTIPAAGATAVVTLSLQSTGEITGRVYLPDGSPAINQPVIVRAKVSTVKDEIPVITDGEGRFRFPLVPAGGFTLTAREDGGEGRTGRSSGSVAAGQTVDVPIQLLRTGSVNVTVMGANGPIHGANVTLSEGAFTGRRWSKTTDTAGIVTFGGADSINEGQFGVQAVDPATGVRGFASATLRSVVEDADGTVAVTVTLVDNAAAIQGRFLRTGATTGIPNAQIVLRSGGKTAYTSTDANGYYRFDGVLVGAFTLEAFDPITARRGRATGTVTTNDTNVTLTVDMVQLALGSITGTVRRSSDNAPIANAQVILYIQGPFGASLFGTTNASGVFNFASVPAGPFSVRATETGSNLTGFVSGNLSGEGETVTADLTLQVQPVGAVSGVISNSVGGPAIDAGVTLFLLPERGQRMTTVDASGVYTFTDVPVGRVRVRASSGLSGDLSEATGEVSFAGDRETINIQFIGTGAVDGVVQMHDGGSISATEVTLVRKTDSIPYYNQSVTTDSEGRFRFERVPLGTLEITANQRFRQLGGSTVYTLTVPNATANVTVTLEPAGSIAGQVLREDGETVAPKMAVELQSADGKVKRFAATDDEGRFSFSDLRLDTYKLHISDPLGAGFVDASGLLSGQGELLDLGELRLDEAPPAVIAISPANGLTFVPVTQTITVQFSEPVQAATVNTTTMIVSTAAGAVSGVWSLNDERTVATFTPAAPYKDFTQISLRVRVGVKDRVGRSLTGESVSSFTTTDATPPSFITRSPMPNALGVPVNSIIRVQWSEIVDPSKFSGGVISVTANGAPVTPARPVEFLQNNTVAVFTPRDPLASDTIYQVTVEPATDLFGNRQASATLYSFRTQDLIAPVLRALQTQGGTVVKSGTTATVLPDLESSDDIAQVEFFVDGQSRLIATTAPYSFTLPVNVAQAMTTTVTAQAVDFSGNQSERKSLVFDLLPDLAPTVEILYPQAGGNVLSGSAVTMTARYADDFVLNRVLFQARGVVGTSINQTLPANTQIFTRTFEVIVPASAAPGSTLTLETSAVDNANQPSPIRSVVFTVADGVAPNVQFQSPANNAAVDAGSTVSVTISASDAGKVAWIKLTATGAAGFEETRTLSPAATSSTVTFAVPVSASAMPTETITLAAQAQDEAGNLSQPTVRTLKIRDGVAPSVTITPAAGEVIAGTSFTVSVAGTDNIQISKLGLTASGAVSQSFNYNVPGTLSTAAATFVVNVPFTATAGSTIALIGTGTDASNNIGSSAAATVTVIADALPTAQISAPADGATVATDTPIAVVVNVTDDVGVAQVQLTADGALSSSQAITISPAATSRTVTFTVQIPGTVELGSSLAITATATDTQGQSSQSSPITLIVGEDRSAPTVAISQPTAGTVVDPGAVFTVSLEAADNVALSQITLDVSGAVTLSQSFTAEGLASAVSLPITVPVTAIGSDIITLSARAEDASGNSSAVVTRTVAVRDVIAPTVALTLPGVADEIIRGKNYTATVTASDEVGLSGLRLLFGGVIEDEQGIDIYPTQPRATHHFVFSVPMTATQGSVLTLIASAGDAAGNVGMAETVTLTVVEDSAPLVNINAPATVGSGSPLTVTVTAEDDLAVAAISFASSGAVITSTVISVTPPVALHSQSFTFNVPSTAVPGSTLVLNASATDSRGQSRSATPVTVTVVDGTTPAVIFTNWANGTNVDPGTTENFTVRATDNGGVRRVDLHLSGAYTLSLSQEISPTQTTANLSFPVALPITLTANTALTLTTVATDSAGNVSQPTTIALNVRDVLAPQIQASVAITEIVAGRSFTVTLNSSDNVGVSSLFLRVSGAVTNNQSVLISPPQANVSRAFNVNVPVNVAAGSVVTITSEARDGQINQGFSTPFTLPVVAPMAQLSGVVLNGTEPVAGADIFVAAANGLFTTTTDSQGEYRLDGLADGKIVVDARHLAGAGYGRTVGTLAGEALVLNVAVNPAILVQSAFDDDAEGWTTAGGSLIWSSGFRYISIMDQSAATIFYFEAPAKFRGDFSAAYGKTLVFDLRRSSATAAVSEADVILVGGGMTLYYRTNRVPNTNFQTYAIPLDLSTLAWTKDSPTGPTPTAAEFQAALADLQALRIRGDYVEGNGYGYLDNVAVRIPTTRVSGTVIDAASQPVAGAAITMTATSGVYVLAADTDGGYAINGVGAGSISVAATAPNGLRRTSTGTLTASGQLTLNVQIPNAPTVQISSPLTGSAALEGATLPVTVTANSSIALARVIFTVDGVAVFTNTVAPYRFDLTLPLDVESLILGARAEDVEGNASAAEPVVISVLSDDKTTVIGRVVDGLNGNLPVEGATILLGSFTASSAADGTFSIADVPTAQGNLTLIARKTIDEMPLQAVVTATPAAGGVTDVGDMVLMVGKFWDGGGANNNWLTAANWNGDTLPGATDDVYIPLTATVTLPSGAVSVNSLRSDGSLTLNGGTLSLAAASTVQTLTMSSGGLTGAGDVTVNASFAWNGGTVSGAGALINKGSATIGNTGARTLTARTLDNRGALVWLDGDIYGQSGARIINRAGALFEIRTHRNLYWQSSYGERPIFENAGTLIKTAGTAAANAIYYTVINTGAIEVMTGTLDFNGGGSLAGTLNVAGNAFVKVSNGYALTDLVANGAGTVQFAGGAVSVSGSYSGTAITEMSGGTLHLNSASLSLVDYAHTSGSMTGSGDVIVNGAMKWSSGSLNGPGSITLNGSLLVEGTGTRTLNERTLDNRGSAVWTGGEIAIQNGAKIINAVGATFDIQTHANIYWQTSYGARGSFENYGALTKSAGTADGTVIYAHFHNQGGVEVQTGSLELFGSGTSGGSFAANAGATLRFHTDHQLLATSALSGAGMVQFTGGAVTVEGAYNVSGVSQINGGGLIVNPTATVQNLGGLVTVNNGTLNLTGLSLATPAITLGSSGVITGSGVLTVTDLLTWSGGSMSGSGRTVTTQNLVIDANTHTLNERTLENRGTALWTAGQIEGHNGAKIINAAGATFDIQTHANIYWQTSYGNRPIFENAGTLLKSAGIADATVFYNSLHSMGTISVTAGVLQLDGGGSISGALHVGAGATVKNGSVFSLSNITVTGGGMLENGSNTLTVSDSFSATAPMLISGGTVQISPATNFAATNLSVSSGRLATNSDAVVNGIFTWTGGTLSGTGRVIVNGSLIMDGSNKQMETLTLENRTSGVWKAGTINAYQGSRLLNTAGAVLEVQGNVQMYWASGQGAQSTLENRGTLIRSAGTGSFTVNSLFNNLGSTQIVTGTMAVSGGGINNGSLHVAAGSVLEINSNYTFGAGTAYSGAGMLRLGSNTLTLSAGAALTVTDLSLNTGTLTGNDDVIVTGAFTWNSTTVSGAGKLRTNGVTTLPANNTRNLHNRLWENAGTVVWQAGVVSFQNGASLTNLAGATLDLRVDNTPLTFSGTRPAFTNGGTVVKSAGTGTTMINHNVVNSGEVRVETGVLSVNSGYTQTAEARLVLSIAGPTVGTELRQLNVTGLATLSGTLEIRRSSGYQPGVGASLSILAFGTRSGEFALVEGVEIAGDRTFQVRYDDAAKRVMLDVVAVDGMGVAAMSAIETQDQPMALPVENQEEVTSHLLYLPVINGNATPSATAEMDTAEPSTEPQPETVSEEQSVEAEESAPVEEDLPVQESGTESTPLIYLPFISN
ncbi:MAG: carboxypeptidase regulatory-like domain-containing protein [Caldilineaceae bacterium]|nr:carboxypeptidase regulatory-like domain-containing protein [Caldilineaceae bacterium]